MQKKSFKSIVLAALALFCVTTLSAKEQFTKEIHKAWTPEQVKELKINSKYGDISVHPMTGDSVIIDVVITVEHSTQNKADYLLDMIDVDFGASGGTVSAVTEFASKFKTRDSFSVDYFVYIPEDRALDFELKYGAIRMNDCTADSKFEVKYGKMYANNLTGQNTQLYLGYSRAEINETNDVKADLKYSKVYIEKAGNIDVTSRYSVVSADVALNFNADSRYDTFSFDELDGFKSTTKYTGITIDKLNVHASIENGYGQITIKEVSPEFESIKINTQYGGVKMGMPADASYNLTVNTSYCSVKYPESNRLNKEKENTSMRLQGVIGDGTPTATVNITSRYGNVNLIP
ncbi:hypothetical protein EYV94_18530 [Puteibacter caeruleilacunae]|nr:hypothetical protein EYV94_18530 [Puteibacter caeruleilacunae]